MLFMNHFEIAEGMTEITLTFKNRDLDEEMLQHMMDFVLDCYNENSLEAE